VNEKHKFINETENIVLQLKRNEVRDEKYSQISVCFMGRRKSNKKDYAFN
jgi:hypothetical protein